MKLRKNGSSLISATALIALSFSGLAAYETEWKDPKFPTDEETNSVFKLEGQIYTGYDFLDHRPNGAPDAAGSDKAGFRVGRAYLSARGEVNRGESSGWDYNVTLDVGRANGIGDGCASLTAGCTKSDPYVAFLKYAVIGIPVFGKNSRIYIGQQPIPVVNGKAGVDLTKYWGYRYLDNYGAQVHDEIGFTPGSTDLGVSYAFKSDYIGLHVMLGNGEGFKRANAEGLSISSTSVSLTNLAKGDATKSYGYDLYALLSFIPTGANKDLHFSVNFPVRSFGVAGGDRAEYERFNLDVSNPAAPVFNLYKGDRRTLRDLNYGVEGDVVLKIGDLSVSGGVGTAIKRDVRGSAIRIDETVINGVNPSDITTISSHYVTEEDAVGVANYVFGSVKLRGLGAFVRLIEGTLGSNTLETKLGAVTRKRWLASALNTDALDGVMGNLTYNQMVNQIDQGRAAYRQIVYGVSYEPTGRLKIALGTGILTGTDSSGKQMRENTLENIKDSTGATTVASQVTDMTVPQYSALWSRLGYTTTDQPVLNDFIGNRSVLQDVFIRAEYSF
jgi:hypothetical protein